jgi:hypothetical protein
MHKCRAHSKAICWTCIGVLAYPVEHLAWGAFLGLLGITL